MLLGVSQSFVDKVGLTRFTIAALRRGLYVQVMVDFQIDSSNGGLTSLCSSETS